ncbi:SubName: Full=Uncharacterized protein {ECO:0000313/EMBL:CCA74227.1} [Serendipita indica DSM 11827]|nr:SubName: Full=Uncharacterized protein {ECO:0000313/EMBL:CCA74227.1} [Serendipita indica DSM 11827]
MMDWLTSISVDVFHPKVLLESTPSNPYILPFEVWLLIFACLAQDRCISPDVIALSHTTSQFRSLTLAMPSLWAHFDLMDHCTERLEEYIRRSDNQPGCIASRKQKNGGKRAKDLAIYYKVDPTRIYDAFVPEQHLAEVVGVFTDLRCLHVAGTTKTTSISFSYILDAFPHLIEFVWEPPYVPERIARIQWHENTKQYKLQTLRIAEVIPRRIPSEIQQILLHCPNLIHLEGGVTSLDTMEELLSTSIQVLHLGFTWIRTPQLMIRFRFPALRVLEFKGKLCWCYRSADVSLGFEDSTYLEKLIASLCIDNVERCMRWIAISGQHPKELHISMYDQSLSRFLFRMGVGFGGKSIFPCLEKLYITSLDNTGRISVQEAINLVTQMSQARSVLGLPRLRVQLGLRWL